METRLADWFKDTADGKEADAILRACVHCGFCTATCPTYQLLGDENDGPRGRIYLMKQVMEGARPTRATMEHLDRCLTCRNCESTCPSGVQYGRLVDIGRVLVEAQVERPPQERALRLALRAKVPAYRDPGPWPQDSHREKVLLLASCTQGSMLPGIDRATARVLDRIGVQSIIEPSSGCCGAVRHHLNDHDGSRANARRNIDAWIPYLDAGVESIVMNASGCGVMVKEYAHLLRHDPYAERAARVSNATVDLSEWLPQRLAGMGAAASGPGQVQAAKTPDAPRVVFHPPCTLQHGQQLRGLVEPLLTRFGARVLPFADAHLCCGSAGTYSVLQPELSRQLRDRKLDALQSPKPDVILSANVGCIAHLESGTGTPVRHWIEWLDERLAQGRAAAG